MKFLPFKISDMRKGVEGAGLREMTWTWGPLVKSTWLVELVTVIGLTAITVGTGTTVSFSVFSSLSVLFLTVFSTIIEDVPFVDATGTGIAPFETIAAASGFISSVFTSTETGSIWTASTLILRGDWAIETLSTFRRFLTVETAFCTAFLSGDFRSFCGTRRTRTGLFDSTTSFMTSSPFRLRPGFAGSGLSSPILRTVPEGRRIVWSSETRFFPVVFSLTVLEPAGSSLKSTGVASGWFKVKWTSWLGAVETAWIILFSDYLWKLSNQISIMKLWLSWEE